MDESRADGLEGELDDLSEFSDYLSDQREEITALPLLTWDQEQRLAHQVESGNKQAGEILVKANLLLSIAQKYQDEGVAREDLIEEGALGLVHAVEKYNYRRSFRFSTYATHWVRQAMVHAIQNQRLRGIEDK